MKKSLFFLLILFLSINVKSQHKLPKEAAKIVEEGKMLYKLEMASWNGTDLMLAKYKNRANIGGYFSYFEGKFTKCVFISKTAKPMIIGTISFDESFSIKTAKTDLTEREMTDNERDIYTLRKVALDEIQKDEQFFKQYENTNLNLIPLINGKEKNVYVLTGPESKNTIIFGNDYLLRFNKKNELIEKKRLHNNILPAKYGDDESSVGRIHSHLPETGDFITATDICTLMLYAKFAKWTNYQVISEKYLNIWDCETNTLLVLPKSVLEKMQDSPKKN